MLTWPDAWVIPPHTTVREAPARSVHCMPAARVAATTACTPQSNSAFLMH